MGRVRESENDDIVINSSPIHLISEKHLIFSKLYRSEVAQYSRGELPHGQDDRDRQGGHEGAEEAPP